MKKLTTQSWEITNEDDEITKIDFEKYTNEVRMSISKGEMYIGFDEEEIKELKNILESTKFIFNQQYENT
jgi:hypothetical protein